MKRSKARQYQNLAKVMAIVSSCKTEEQASVAVEVVLKFEANYKEGWVVKELWRFLCSLPAENHLTPLTELVKLREAQCSHYLARVRMLF